MNFNLFLIFNCKERLKLFRDEGMKLTSLAGSQDSGAKGIDAVNETVMVVTHRVTRQETSIAQRRELLLPVAGLDHVSVHQVPVIQGLLEGVFVVSQNLLRFSLSVTETK